VTAPRRLRTSGLTTWAEQVTIEEDTQMGRGSELLTATRSTVRQRSARHVVSSALRALDEKLRWVPATPVDGAIDERMPLELSTWSIVEDTLLVRLLVTDSRSPSAPTAAYVKTGASMCILPISVLSGRLTSVRLPPGWATPILVCRLADGRYLEHADPASLGLREDPATRLFLRFADELRARPVGTALEIGSRARSGNIYRDALVPNGWEYVGVDVAPGTNVDVVGDAHDLESVVRSSSFDAVYSIATFEHLAMPWVAAVSINRVLRTGGLAFVATHQSYPLHELPCDYFRFSDEAWTSLFNDQTGFEILATALGEPAYVVPRYRKSGRVAGVERGPAYLSSSVLAVKRGDASSEWAPGPRVASRHYPA
jgi:Methyltransferase domain